MDCQVPLPMKFSRQEYWTGVPSSTPGNLPNPGREPVSLVCPALAGGFFTTSECHVGSPRIKKHRRCIYGYLF